jgi:hypothetical protein
LAIVATPIARAHGEREYLGDEKPEDRAEADRKKGDVGHETADCEPLESGQGTAERKASRQDQKRDSYSARAAEEQGPSSGTIDDFQGHDGKGDIDHTDAGRGEDGRRGGFESGRLDDCWRVIDDGVYSGDLLKDGKPDA